MNGELKKIVNRVKATQAQVQKVLSNKSWLEDARNFAEKQGREVKKLFADDVTKVKTFIERERKGLELIQKQLPAEMKKIKKFVDQQKKELEKMLATVRKSGGKAKAKTSPKKSASSGKSATRKKTTRKSN